MGSSWSASASPSGKLIRGDSVIAVVSVILSRNTPHAREKLQYQVGYYKFIEAAARKMSKRSSTAATRSGVGTCRDERRRRGGRREKRKSLRTDRRGTLPTPAMTGSRTRRRHFWKFRRGRTVDIGGGGSYRKSPFGDAGPPTAPRQRPSPPLAAQAQPGVVDPGGVCRRVAAWGRMPLVGRHWCR